MGYLESRRRTTLCRSGDETIGVAKAGWLRRERLIVVTVARQPVYTRQAAALEEEVASEAGEGEWRTEGVVMVRLGGYLHRCACASLSPSQLDSSLNAFGGGSEPVRCGY